MENNTNVYTDEQENYLSIASVTEREFNSISDKIFPVVPVDKRADKFQKFNIGEGHQLIGDEQTRWAVRTEANTIETSMSEDTWSTETHALGMDITDEALLTVAGQAAVNVKFNKVVNTLLTKREQLFYDEYMQAGQWHGNVAGTNGGATDLSNITAGTMTSWADESANIVDDISKLKRAFRGMSGGIAANKAVITEDIFDAIRGHASIGALVMGGATVSDPALIDDAFLRSLFGVEVYIADAQYSAYNSTTGELEGTSFGDQKILFTHSPDSAEPSSQSAGLTFTWRKNPVASYNFDVNVYSGGDLARRRVLQNIVVATDFDQKLVEPKLGLLVTDVLASA